MVDLDDMEKTLSESIETNKEDEIAELKKKVVTLERTLWEYGIEEESTISDEEYICIVQLERLRELSEYTDLSEQEVRIFDILNKNLRMIRSGVEKKSPKGKKLSKGDLLKIVDGKK